jgi:hypothetical protein
VAPRSEKQLAAALAAAVQDYAAACGDRSLQAIQEALDDLLYRRGSDGILELSVSQPEAASLTLVGIVIWVEEQTLGPLEAVFSLDEAGSVTRFSVRAGDARLPRHDAPAHALDSWRSRLRFVEARPTADEDWEYVLHYKIA